METAKRLRESLQYIDNHLEDSITVPEIAGAMGY